jgi:hypothetical protein
MTNFQSLSLSIFDESTLDRASEHLHDAVFRREWISFDEQSRVLNVRFWREVPDVIVRERAFLFLYRVKILRSACLLSFRSVDCAQIEVKDELKYYTVFGLSYKRTQRVVTFDTEGAINVAVTISDIDAELTDIGQTTWEQFGHTTLTL